MTDTPTAATGAFRLEVVRAALEAETGAPVSDDDAAVILKYGGWTVALEPAATWTDEVQAMLERQALDDERRQADVLELAPAFADLLVAELRAELAAADAVEALATPRAKRSPHRRTTRTSRGDPDPHDSVTQKAPRANGSRGLLNPYYEGTSGDVHGTAY